MEWNLLLLLLMLLLQLVRITIIERLNLAEVIKMDILNREMVLVVVAVAAYYNC